MIAPRKRSIDEIIERYHSKSLPLLEPIFSEKQGVLFERGVVEFNQTLFYDAHESWEHCWRAMRNDVTDDSEIIVRGLVQLAAGFHCIQQQRKKDAKRNFQKALPKIDLAPVRLFNLDFHSLQSFLHSKEFETSHLFQEINFQEISFPKLLLLDKNDGARNHSNGA
ncbi:MAG: DUF309 domain-containing protein [Chloroherpetonaceae bacterium]|nr:DUF309 domain-containing protein [Chloroherpetonaceae bacterium]